MRSQSAVALVICFVAASTASLAQIQVPPECIQIATREGFPTDVMSKTQAARARYRLSKLSDNDPIVRPCRDAIAQLKAMQREMRR